MSASTSVRPTFPTSRIPAVNVATVPQRSLLRYPGGKTWLIPHVREWLESRPSSSLLEPFAGGGIVSLTAVMEGLVDRTIMVELDHDVAAFWHCALRHGSELSERIRQFQPTREALKALDSNRAGCLIDQGFRTLVLNRTRRGGILAPGASFSRVGENGKGVLSRWYPQTLMNRLKGITEHADRIVFCEGDGMQLLEPLLQGRGGDAAVFVDPPYTAAGGKRAGARLYTHSDVDHAALFRLLARHSTNFLMTYDQAPEIVSLIEQFGFSAVAVKMKNTHHNYLSELVITPEPLFL